MGGSQALSRSLFAQLVPKSRETEYFSVYEISDKGTSWISPILFGIALQLTGRYRVAILSLVVFFSGGLVSAAAGRRRPGAKGRGGRRRVDYGRQASARPPRDVRRTPLMSPRQRYTPGSRPQSR